MRTDDFIQKTRDYFVRSASVESLSVSLEESVDKLISQLLLIWFLQKRSWFNKDSDYLIKKFSEISESKKLKDCGSFHSFLRYFLDKICKLDEDSFYEDDLIGKVLTVGSNTPLLNYQSFDQLFIPDKCYYLPRLRIDTAFFKNDLCDVPLFNILDKRDYNSKEIRSIISSLHEKELSPLQRKKRGTFYTPEVITSYICNKTIEMYLINRVVIEETSVKIDSIEKLINSADEKLLMDLFDRIKDITILDPAMGTGHFLVEATKVLEQIHLQIKNRAKFLKIERKFFFTFVTKGKQQQLVSLNNFKDEIDFCNFLKIHLIFPKNLYGVDLDARTVDIAKTCLFLMLNLDANDYESSFRIPKISFNLYVGDSLIGYSHKLEIKRDLDKEELRQEYNRRFIHEFSLHEVNPASFDSFHWSLIVTEVMENNSGFDVVIANPPWSSKFRFKSEEMIKQIYSVSRNLNLFSLFLVRSLELLNPTGRFGLLIPKVFVKNKAYVEYRKRLYGKIIKISDWGQFPKVASETISIIGSKTLTGLDTIASEAFDEDGKTISKNLIPINAIASSTDFIIPLFLNQSIYEIILDIKRNSRNLADFLIVKRGMEYGQKGKIIRCTNCSHYTEKPAKKYRMSLTKNCPSCNNSIDISAGSSRSFISHNRQQDILEPLLSGRCINRWRITQNLFIAKNLSGIKYKEELMGQPRILIQRISKRIKATMDEGYSYILNTVYCLIPKKTNRTSLTTLLCILNSDLMSFYYEYLYNIGMSLTTQVTIDFLKSIPIKIPLSNNSLKILGEFLLFLHEEDTLTQSETDLIMSMNNICNALIYELYFQERLSTRLNERIDRIISSISNFQSYDEKLSVIQRINKELEANKGIQDSLIRIKNQKFVQLIDSLL